MKKTFYLDLLLLLNKQNIHHSKKYAQTEN